jgi:tetratricopeptide (TPR) repeat protein
MSPRRLFALLFVLLLGCGRSPQHDFDAGVAYFKAEKFAKAEVCFARAVAGGAPTTQAFNFLGVCQLQEGKADAAIQSFQEALKLDPGHAAARQNLALAYLEQGKTDDAIPLLRQLPAAQSELGLAYLRTGQWGQARQLLLKSGDSPDILNALGVANAHLGNYREAKSDFEKCITAAPDFAAAYLNLAVAERHLDQKATALRHYQRFLELQPQREDVRLAVAQLEQELTAPRPKPVEVVAAPPPKPVEPVKPPPPVEQPAAPKPEPAPTPVATPPPPPVKRRAPVATQTLKAGNRAKAQAFFTEGIAFQQQGKVPTAVASYGKAIVADPTFANAYYNLAIAYRDSHQTERALDNYELALIANPKFLNARINYAILLAQEGFTADAIVQYEKALQENPNDSAIQYAVARLYASDKATNDKARQHFQQFLKLSPNSPSARDVRRWLEQNP